MNFAKRWILLSSLLLSLVSLFVIVGVHFSCMIKSFDYLQETSQAVHYNINYEQLRPTKNGTVPLTEIEPKPKSFFFVETSGRQSFGFKELCSVESCAFHHPNQSVNLITTNQLLNWNPVASGLLERYPNIHIKYINFESFVLNSKLSHIWESGQIQNSQHLISHLSDILRFLLLERYGGTYMDLDQIVLRPFPSLPNFIGKESFWIAAGVMRFERSHAILQDFLRAMLSSFNGNDWGSNGPQLVSKIIMKFCKADSLDLQYLTPERCQGIKIFAPESFYPIHWTEWDDFFDPLEAKAVLKKLNSTFSAHLWGKQSETAVIRKAESGQAYAILAQKYCPITYELSYL